MSIGKGIKLSTGFDLNSKAPLDNRTLFATIEERDLLPDINKYNGLICYVESTQKNYIYKNGEWSLFGGGSGGYHIGAEPPSDTNLLWIDNSSKYTNIALQQDYKVEDILFRMSEKINELEKEIIYLKSKI